MPSRPPPWIFACVYALHLADEGTLSGGIARWSTENGFYFTLANWQLASSLSMVAVLVAVLLVQRETWPSWVLVAIAAHLTLHLLVHAGGSLAWGSVSPGAPTGILLVLPLAVWSGRWGLDALDRRTFVRAVLVGAATFQAPWDLLVRLLLGIPIWTPGQRARRGAARMSRARRTPPAASLRIPRLHAATPSGLLVRRQTARRLQ